MGEQMYNENNKNMMQESLEWLKFQKRQIALFKELGSYYISGNTDKLEDFIKNNKDFQKEEVYDILADSHTPKMFYCKLIFKQIFPQYKNSSF